MYYEPMPLYPPMRPCRDRDTCVRVPVFEGDRCASPHPLGECRRVTVENPCRPGECAEVTLGVDACGNLLVCVRRAESRECGCPPKCRPRRAPRCLPDADGCGRGRLYGTWR